MRIALLAALVAGAWTAAACAASSFGGPPSGPTDAGAGSPGAGAFDAATGDGDAAPPRLVALHASPNVFDLRVCFVVEGSDGGARMAEGPAQPSDPSVPMPRTSYPGVPRGGGAVLSGAPLTPGARLGVRAVNAYKVGDRSCTELFAQPPEIWADGSDYFDLGAVDVPPDARPGQLLVLAIAGCPVTSGFAGGVARCGPGWTATGGNLRAVLLSAGDVDPTASPPRFEVLHLSPTYAESSVRVSVGPLDGGADAEGLELARAVPYLEAGARATATLAPADLDVATVGLHAVPPSPDAGAPFALSLAQLARLSAPARAPGELFARGHFVLALMGDGANDDDQLVTADGGTNPAWKGTGLHFVAVPAP